MWERQLGCHMDELLRLVDALQFTEEHGEVCPANWKKGDSGMTAASLPTCPARRQSVRLCCNEKAPLMRGFFIWKSDQSSSSIQPPISFQRLTMPQNSSAVFSVS